MAFAEDYEAEITLAYYCFNIALTIAFFIFGTIYLWYKNRKDQQRRELRDRTDQQRREWRQFAERIYSKYSELKAAGVTRKISKVRDTFQKIRIKSTITGLDVLRYMLADANYERSKTTELECLGEDLLSIFQLFNVCSSLLFLGEIPVNIKEEELTDVVTELGNIALPFFKGKQRGIISKCLEHFGNGRPKPETDLDARLKATVPYITSCLRFASQERTLKLFGRDSSKCSDYSKCSDFSLDVGVVRQGINQVNLTSLMQLHRGLVRPRFKADFARELRQHPVQLIFEKLNDDDEDELVVVKVLHEVRCYIHLHLNENHLVEHREQIEANLMKLRVVEKEVTRVRPTKDKLEEICYRFIEDLQRLSGSPYHYKSQDFCEQLHNLRMKLCEIQIKRVDPSLPSTSQTANQGQETVV